MIDIVLNYLNVLEMYLLIQIEEDLLYYSIAIAAIFGKIKEGSKRNILSVWIMYFIGTFFHELMHLVVSFITNGKPKWFSILPTSNFNENGKLESYTLGYVRSENIRWYNTFYISMAPLLLIYLSFYIHQNFFNYFEVTIYSYLSYIFLIISLLFSSIPSGADFRILFSSTNYIKVLNKKKYLKNTNKIFNFIPIIFIGAVTYYSLGLGL